MVLQRTEVQHDFRHFACHAFAGTQVERYAFPTFVFDFGFDGDIGFSETVFRYIDFFQIAVHAVCCNILAANNIFVDGFDGQRFQRFDGFHFLVAYGIGIQALRSFHRSHTKHLHQVVLHHIAQCAGNVVKLAAFFHAQLLGDGQLYAFNIFVVPQRLEHHIGKTQGQQVLQAFFTQIMVDTVDLLFFEITGHICIDLLGRGQVRTQRFFQNHAHVIGIQTDFGKVFTGLRKEFRRS